MVHVLMNRKFCVPAYVIVYVPINWSLRFCKP